MDETKKCLVCGNDPCTCTTPETAAETVETPVQ